MLVPSAYTFDPTMEEPESLPSSLGPDTPLYDLPHSEADRWGSLPSGLWEIGPRQYASIPDEMEVTAPDEGAEHPYQPLNVRLSLPASDEQIVTMRVPFAIMSVDDLLAKIGYLLTNDAEWGYRQGAPPYVIRSLNFRGISYRPGDASNSKSLSSINLGPECTVHLLLKEPPAPEQERVHPYGGSVIEAYGFPQLQWSGNHRDDASSAAGEAVRGVERDPVSGPTPTTEGDHNLCCSLAMTYNLMRLNSSASLADDATLGLARRIHADEANAPADKGMNLIEQSTMALNMGVASAIVYPDLNAIVILGVRRPNLISLAVMEGKYHQRSWFEARNLEGRMMGSVELDELIAHFQWAVVPRTLCSLPLYDRVGTTTSKGSVPAPSAIDPPADAKLTEDGDEMLRYVEQAHAVLRSLTAESHLSRDRGDSDADSGSNTSLGDPPALVSVSTSESEEEYLYLRDQEMNQAKTDESLPGGTSRPNSPIALSEGRALKGPGGVSEIKVKPLPAKLTPFTADPLHTPENEPGTQPMSVAQIGPASQEESRSGKVLMIPLRTSVQPPGDGCNTASSLIDDASTNVCDRLGLAPPGELTQQRVERLPPQVALRDVRPYADERSSFHPGSGCTYTWRQMPLGLTPERRLEYLRASTSLRLSTPASNPAATETAPSAPANRGDTQWTYVTFAELRSFGLVAHAANEPRKLLMDVSNKLARAMSIRQQYSMADISVREVCSRFGITSGGDRGRIVKYTAAIMSYQRRALRLDLTWEPRRLGGDGSAPSTSSAASLQPRPRGGPSSVQYFHSAGAAACSSAPITKKALNGVWVEVHGATRNDINQSWFAIAGAPLHGIHSVAAGYSTGVADLQYLAAVCFLEVVPCGDGPHGHDAALTMIAELETTSWLRGPAYFLVVDSSTTVNGSCPVFVGVAKSACEYASMTASPYGLEPMGRGEAGHTAAIAAFWSYYAETSEYLPVLQRQQPIQPYSLSWPIPQDAPPYICFSLMMIYNTLRVHSSPALDTVSLRNKGGRLHRQCGDLDYMLEPRQQLRMLDVMSSCCALIDRDVNLVVVIGANPRTCDNISLGWLESHHHVRSYFEALNEPGRMLRYSELLSFAGEQGFTIVHFPECCADWQLRELGVLTHEPTRIISVEGTIGSGKTTVLQLLREKHAGDEGIAFVDEPVQEWLDQGFINRAYSEPAAALPFQMMALTSLTCDLHRALLRKPTPRVIITERSPWGDFQVFARSNLDDRDLEMYTFTFNRLLSTLPDNLEVTYVFLRANICTLETRINRDRQDDSRISTGYLRALNDRHENWLLHERRVAVLDANEDAAVVFDAMCQLGIVTSHEDVTHHRVRNTPQRPDAYGSG